MTINHIDQLAEWWENAEEGAASEGDTVIWRNQRHRSGTYAYEVGRQDRDEAAALPDYLRILSRAQKPKPAWHDAPAVIASTDYCERQVWERDTTHENRWYGTAGGGAVTSDLRDVTPLIEAKVTDEMVKRASTAFWAFDGAADESMPAALQAALGLDPA